MRVIAGRESLATDAVVVVFFFVVFCISLIYPLPQPFWYLNHDQSFTNFIMPIEHVQYRHRRYWFKKIKVPTWNKGWWLNYFTGMHQLFFFVEKTKYQWFTLKYLFVDTYVILLFSQSCFHASAFLNRPKPKKKNKIF